MSLLRIRKDHLGLIAWSHTKYNIRGGAGLVFVFLTLITGLTIASMFISPIEELGKATNNSSDALLGGFIQQIGRPALKWILDDDVEQADYLISQKPALVSVFILSLLIGLPFMVSLGGFNQLSGDIGSRGIRYLLLRTERINLFFGRFIGTYLFSLIVFFIILSIVALYMIFKANFYPALDVLLFMLQGFLILAIYSLPYMALCAWISASIDSPFGSLVLGQLIIGFFPIFVSLAHKIVPQAGYAIYAMPWGFKYWLIHPNIIKVISGILAMLGFTAVFLLLGTRHFQKRDL